MNNILLKESDITKMVEQTLGHLFENLYTHDDEKYSLLRKLKSLNITWHDNPSEKIIEVDTPNEGVRKKVMELLNYYGWQIIKNKKKSVTIERIYGDSMDDFYDEEAESDQDEDSPEYNYEFGEGIFYHITPSKNVESILAKGLKPKDNKKLGYDRGKRIYLMSYPDPWLAQNLFKRRGTNLTILKIDLREYIGNQIKTYHDDLYDAEGSAYTYDYIPPQCISVYREIKSGETL